jgi:hypothetical protein
VITGTGRAGTTFLVLLLSELGLDTGFNADRAAGRIDEVGRAGLEHDIRRDGSPYVVKNPRFCTYAADVVARDDIAIDHVFVPIRDLHAAAESRRQVSGAAPVQGVGGGLWHTSSTAPGDQEAALLQQLYELLVVLSGTAIPVTLMRYPRLVTDPAYLFDKLRPVLGDIEYETFVAAFRKFARPDLVHSYNANDR